MSLGLQNAYMNAAMEDSVRRRIADQLAEEQRRKADIQQQFENQLKTQTATQAADLHAAQLASLNDARAQAARTATEGEAAKLAPMLTINQSLPEGIAGRLRGTMQGAFLQDNPPLAQPPIAGMMQPDIVPGQQPGTVWTGTDPQRTVEEQKLIRGRLLSSPTITAREKTAIEMENAGLKVPAGMFGPNAPQGIHDTAGGLMRPNATTGQMEPVLGPGGKPLQGYHPPKDTSGATNTRLDRSYQFNSSQIEKLRTPVAQKADRIGTLLDNLDQRTPQADALLAPEILSAAVGGQGSGLRMNEAEISRIIGGRSKWETLKATLNKWSLDPTKALSVTDEQRAEMRQIAAAMHTKATGKLSAIDEANQALVDAEDVTSHRRITSDLKTKLSTIDSGGGGSPQPAAGDTASALAILNARRKKPQ